MSGRCSCVISQKSGFQNCAVTVMKSSELTLIYEYFVELLPRSTMDSGFLSGFNLRMSSCTHTVRNYSVKLNLLHVLAFKTSEHGVQ